MTNSDKKNNDDTERLSKGFAESNIQRFYAGKTLFLTGSTGFMGKCLLEKLLRSCPDVKRIYVLIREKKGKSPEERIEKYFEDVLFDTLRTVNPDFKSKIHLIIGDLLQDDIALSKNDRNTLIKEVNIILHNASNVKFMEKLSTSLKINVLGTKVMLELAKECKNLDGFMYMSTAYSHCYRKNIMGEAYPAPVDMKMVHELIATDAATSTGITGDDLSRILGDFPTTYTFTKAIAEGLVDDVGKEVSFPCIVYRPAVVLSTWKEPVRGWCGNANGPALLLLGAGLGLLHTTLAGDFIFDMIPVDMSINALLVVIWDATKKRTQGSGAHVYNYGSSVEMPMTLRRFDECAGPAYGIEPPSKYVMWKPFVVHTNCIWYFMILHALFHYIPAALIDSYMWISGKKPRAVSTLNKVNFVLTQFTSLALAGLLRSSLNPSAVPAATRHAFGLVIGLFLGYFCFGKQAVHLAGLPALCYIAMRTQDPRVMQKHVLTIALVYLSCIHFYRQTYDYGSYSLDITGPLMVITQKVISLAYSIHDGLTRHERELTPTQRNQAVRMMPTALEYFSYVFHFQALMAGPVIFYRDYIDFIHGSGLQGAKPLATFYDDAPNKVTEIVLEPSPAIVVVKKVVASLTCAVIFVAFIPSYPILRVKNDEFLDNTSVAYKIWYLMISTMMVRFKYYYAWLFADAICNHSGLGRNGQNPDGSPRWDLISNVDIIPFETSLSLKGSIDAWNKGTNRWLRSIVYERAGRHKTIVTYALSALWHGFYPGYYLTFASGALFTFASRSVRRHIRPYFVNSKVAKFFYDVMTFITTRIVLAYVTFSFVLLEFLPSVKVYLSMYLAPHLLGLAAIFLLPLLPLGHTKKKKTEVESTNGTTEVINGYAKKSE